MSEATANRTAWNISANAPHVDWNGKAKKLEESLSKEPLLSDRVIKLKERVLPRTHPLCVEKGRLITESYKETEGEPTVIRRAKSLAKILDNITIFIEDGELIVGNAASKPAGLNIDFEQGTWPRQELLWLQEDSYCITPEEIDEVEELNKYWRSRNNVSAMRDVLDYERLWTFSKSGIRMPRWKSKEQLYGGGYAQGGLGLAPGLFLWCGDYRRVLNQGIGSIIQEAEEELKNLRFTSPDTIHRLQFLKAVIIGHQSIIRFAHRFADLATRLASVEMDPARKMELEQIAESCRWVPENPARNFREAIQSFWFIFLTVMTPSPTASAGRFDQYMYPFYQKDMAEGRITNGEVLELLECLRIKDMDIKRTSGKINRAKNEGMAKWHNFTIGGLTPGGDDATNELTFLILEAARRCQTPHHTITLRVHDDTPDALMVKAIEVVKTGLGMPAFIGDQSYIDFLLRNGVSLEDARDYLMTGCLDVNLPGKSRSQFGMFIAALVFDIFMNEGLDPNTGDRLFTNRQDLDSVETFDELVNMFKEQLGYTMELLAERNMGTVKATRELFPDPVRSSMNVDGVKVGKDMFLRTMPFENGICINPVGMINIADSLAAIKKLVFDEKKVTLKELRAATAANWQGYEGLRKMCLSAPKFGNDDDYVDAIARDLYGFWADKAVTLDSPYGGKYIPTAISITAHAPGGEMMRATPDGRWAGEALADGTMSPMRGRDTRGVIASLKSAAKIDQGRYQATLLNIKFHPSALKSTEDMTKLSALIKTYFHLNGKHIQFNVVNRQTLVDAQKHPENHRDLTVRMAGFSAYFVQLNKITQDDIIGRTEHQQPT